MWSGELGIPLHVLGSEENGAATSVSLPQDGTTVAVGYHTGYVRVYDVGTGTVSIFIFLSGVEADSVYTILCLYVIIWFVLISNVYKFCPAQVNL